MLYRPTRIDPDDLEKTLRAAIQAAVDDASAFVLLVGRPAVDGVPGEITGIVNCSPLVAVALIQGFAAQLETGETIQ